MTGPPTGRHVGAKLSALMHDARVAAAERIIPAETAHRAEYHKAFMEQVEQDLAPTMRAMFQDIHDDPECPEQAKAFLGPLMNPEHQGQFFLTVLALLGIGLAGPQAAAAGWVQRLQNASLHAHGDLRLSPEAAALAVVKGVAGVDAMYDEARYAGMTRDIFNGLVEITGEPPGPQQLGEALRRGYIDTERFAHGIRQGRTRNEWIDVLERLRFAPPTPGEVIAGAVEGHLDEADARRRLGEAGIDPDNYGWLYETAGRPPGTQEMLQLLNRGLVSEAEVRAAIRESDVKNKYTDAILHMRDHLLPQRSLVSMVRHGVIDDADARSRLSKLGIDAAAQDALVKEAHSTKGTGARELSIGETLSLYNEGLVDRPRAHGMLVALKFDDASANELLGLADVQRAHKLIAASVTRIRSSFVGHKIDAAQARTALDALHVETATRDHAIELWTTERGSNIKHLTEAQVAKAWNKGLIDDAGFVSRHLAMGYTEDDARLLMALDA